MPRRLDPPYGQVYEEALYNTAMLSINVAQKHEARADGKAALLGPAAAAWAEAEAALGELLGLAAERGRLVAFDKTQVRAVMEDRVEPGVARTAHAAPGGGGGGKGKGKRGRKSKSMKRPSKSEL